MDGSPCSWSTARVEESFSRSRPAADTLSRLAKLMARAEQKQDSWSQRQHPTHLPCVCPECGLGFPDMVELLHHQEVKHTLPKPHQCLSCGKGFSLLSSLQLHKCVLDASPCEICLGEPPLGAPCPACISGASDPDSPQDKSPHHQPHLHDSSPYACALCGRGFSQKQALLYHQQAGCSEAPSPLTVDDTSSPPPDSPPAVSEAGSTPSDSSDTPGPSGEVAKQCPFCSRSFSTGAGLHCHKRIAHPKELLMAQKAKGGDAGGGGGGGGVGIKKVNGSANVKPKSKQKLLTCRSCDMVFKSTAKLYRHRKEKHSREKDIRRDPRPVIAKRRKGETYPCLVCGKVFLHHLSLWAHSKQHAASTISTIQKQKLSQSVGNTAKDSKLAGKQPKKLKLNLVDNKTVKTEGKASPGSKVSRLEEGFNRPGRPRKVPRVEEDMDREFPCPSCPHVFSLQSELRDHVELHQSSVTRRNCSVCTQEMDTRKRPGSKRHRLYHCVPCQQAFSALEPFLDHCQDHLRIKVEEDIITEDHIYHGNKD